MRWLVVALALVGCGPTLEPIDRFDGEFAAAREKRRLLALVSPT